MIPEQQWVALGKEIAELRMQTLAKENRLEQRVRGVVYCLSEIDVKLGKIADVLEADLKLKRGC